MSNYQYSVIPSPRKGKTGKGLKGVQMKFANALASVMNEMAANGWEFVRAETLPCEERQGLTGKTVNYHSMLVFRRPFVVAEPEEDEEETLGLPAPDEEEEFAAEDDLAHQDDEFDTIEDPDTIEDQDAGEDEDGKKTVAAE